MQLCKERGYRYQVVEPDITAFHDQENTIYAYETYEPLIINQ
jgi:hypothetical protein